MEHATGVYCSCFSNYRIQCSSKVPCCVSLQDDAHWPRLALLSFFPGNWWSPPYQGPGANLTANSSLESCIKAPSVKWSSETHYSKPQKGWCSTDGRMPPGIYQLQQVAPAGTELYIQPIATLNGWDCYTVQGGRMPLIESEPPGPNMTHSVMLQEWENVTCVAHYRQIPTCADTHVNDGDITPFNCPRPWTLKPNAISISEVSPACCVSKLALYRACM